MPDSILKLKVNITNNISNPDTQLLLSVGYLAKFYQFLLLNLQKHFILVVTVIKGPCQSLVTSL